MRLLTKFTLRAFTGMSFTFCGLGILNCSAQDKVIEYPTSYIPLYLVFDKGGNLWYNQNGNGYGKINVSNGNEVFAFPNAAGPNAYYQLAGTPSANIWMVNFNTSYDSLIKFDPATGNKTVIKLPFPTFVNPRDGLYAAADGNIYLTGFGNATASYESVVMKFDQQSNWTELKLLVNESACRLTSGEDGNLYVVGAGNGGNIIKIDPVNMTVTGRYSLKTLQMQSDICAGPIGTNTIWITLPDQNKIAKLDITQPFNSSSAIVEYDITTYTGISSSYPYFTVLDTKCNNIWFSMRNANAIGKVDLSLADTNPDFIVYYDIAALGGISGSAPGELDFDLNNNLWFAETSIKQVGKLIRSITNSFVNDTNICVGNCINFTNTGKGNITRWQWSFSGSSRRTDTAQNPVNICYDSSGVYDVILIVSNGCESDTLTKTKYIVVAGPPTVTVAASPVSIRSGESTTLTASGGITYQWSPSTGLSCTTCANPTAIPDQTIDYCVEAADANGCAGNACVTINIDVPCGTLYIPNAFSPNNDLENDMHCVLGGCIEKFHITIYDRWGEKVFESTDQRTGWDGTYKGKLLNTAVFVYDLKATLASGEKINKKGNISLLR